eukprot:scaffold10581_cov117-Isochrysis_galbana.AAC.7
MPCPRLSPAPLHWPGPASPPPAPAGRPCHRLPYRRKAPHEQLQSAGRLLRAPPELDSRRGRRSLCRYTGGSGVRYKSVPTSGMARPAGGGSASRGAGGSIPGLPLGRSRSRRVPQQPKARFQGFSGSDIRRACIQLGTAAPAFRCLLEQTKAGFRRSRRAEVHALQPDVEPEGVSKLARRAGRRQQPGITGYNEDVQASGNGGVRGECGRGRSWATGGSGARPQGAVHPPARADGVQAIPPLARERVVQPIGPAATVRAYQTGQGRRGGGRKAAAGELQRTKPGRVRT